MGSIDVARARKRRDQHVAHIGEAGAALASAIQCLVDARDARDWLAVGMDETPFWREWYGYGKDYVGKLCACLPRLQRIPTDDARVSISVLRALAGTPIEETPELVREAKKLAGEKDIPLPQAAKEVADTRKGKPARPVPAAVLAAPVITVEDVTEGHPQLAPRKEEAQDEEVVTEGGDGSENEPAWDDPEYNTTEYIESIFGSLKDEDSIASDPRDPVDPALTYAELSRLWPRLAPKCKAHYVEDCRLHLEVDAAMKACVPVLREALKNRPKIGDDRPYLHKIREIARRSGPHHWAVCRSCQGSGEVKIPNGEMIQCGGCRGAGYHV